MDDLLDLDWQKGAASSSGTRNGTTTANAASTSSQRSASPFTNGANTYSSYSFDALSRALPSSSSSPFKPTNRVAQPIVPTQKPAAASTASPAGSDAFSSLLSFGGQASTSTATDSRLSLADRQKASMSGLPSKSISKDSWAADAGWDAFEQASGPTIKAQPTPTAPSTTSQVPRSSRSRDPFDFDNSLDFEQPPPTARQAAAAPSRAPSDPFDFADFEDSPLPSRSATNSQQEGHPDESDDFLGALGRPVDHHEPRAVPKQPAGPALRRPPSPPPHLLGRIVEMGFSPQEAREALGRTDTGLDVEAALEMLLSGRGNAEDQDRELAMRLQHDEDSGRDREMEEYEERERRRRAARRGKVAANAQDGNGLAVPRSTDSPGRRSPRNGPRSTAASGSATPLDEIDWQKQADQLYSTASELGASVFSKANAFWSSAKAQAAKTLEEQMQSGRATPAASEATGASGSGRASPATDSVAAAKAWARRWGNQPKPSERKEWEGKPRWMVEAEEAERQQTSGDTSLPEATDSAAGFKDSDNEDEAAPPFIPAASVSQVKTGRSTSPSTDISSNAAKSMTGNLWDDHAPSVAARGTATAASSAKAPPAAPKPYVSSARWGKSKPVPAAASPTTSMSSRAPQPQPLPQRDLDPADHSAPGRSSTLKSQGNEAFKKGAYGEAEGLYTQALDSLGDSSLRRVALFNNRAQARLKNGEARGAMEDCTAVIALVLSNDAAAANGSGSQSASVIYRATLDPALPESLSGEVVLRDAYSKALLRRAQAAEALEKWAAAQADWSLLERYEKEQGSSAKEGFKNLTSARDGKARCESMLSGGKTKMPPTSSFRRTATAPAAVRRPAAQSAQPSLATVQLPDDSEERLALKDSIESRISAWTSGKESNIRALLTSLDTILWPELQWKKVQMSEVLTDGQIKKVYWRAIGRCHPDKIKRDETLERRMLAAGVFGVLNEAFAASQK